MYTILRFPRNDDPASRNIRNTTNIYERYGLSAKLADASVSNAKEVAELIDFLKCSTGLIVVTWGVVSSTSSTTTFVLDETITGVSSIACPLPDTTCGN